MEDLTTRMAFFVFNGDLILTNNATTTTATIPYVGGTSGGTRSPHVSCGLTTSVLHTDQ